MHNIREENNQQTPTNIKTLVYYKNKKKVNCICHCNIIHLDLKCFHCGISNSAKDVNGARFV